MLWLACTTPDPCADCDTAAEVEEVTFDAPTAEWDDATLAAAVQEVLEQGYVGPTELKAVYLDALSHGDADCPGLDNNGELTTITDDWIIGCTSDEGWFYSGVALYDENSWSDEHATNVTLGMGGDFEIRSDDEDKFTVGGHFALRLALSGQTITMENDVNGSWLFENEAGWLGEGMGTLTWIDGTVTPDGRSVTLNGGIQVGDDAFYFDDVTWDDSQCWDQPTGTLRVRDPSGVWFRVALSDDCSGCGALTYGDEDAGEACVDLSSMPERLLGPTALIEDYL